MLDFRFSSNGSLKDEADIPRASLFQFQDREKDIYAKRGAKKRAVAKSS